MTAAAVTNPGMAAWKALLWEGELVAGQVEQAWAQAGSDRRTVFVP